MSTSVLYHCSHQEAPRAPLPPAFPSTFADFSPLNTLYFCEECDAIRCEQCVAVEVPSYFCPNCLFEVPGANVRGDKNRCARSCFSCPQCYSSLTIMASTDQESSRPPTHNMPHSGPPYSLLCPACKWSSREINWLFDKPSALASQLSKVYPYPDNAQAEYDAIKSHLDTFVKQQAPPEPPSTAHRRTPSRHIAQITQAAARALRRDIPGMPPARSRAKSFSKAADKGVVWDVLSPYESKSTWRKNGMERGTEDVEEMAEMEGEDVASLEKRWANSWEPSRLRKAQVPERIPLQAKLTKRCPQSGCRHILIQPDTKSVRMLIKMVASNYLPAVELGRRRRRLGEDITEDMTEGDLERRRRERRRTRVLPVREEDEELSSPLRRGNVYTFQLAFTNPLYDPIQIRLSNAHQAKSPVPVNHQVFIPTAHFTVGALKDAWAYDEEDDDDTGADDDLLLSANTDDSRKRMSLAGTSHRHRSGRDAGVEKRANITKVGLEVEIGPTAPVGTVEFDLEVRFTYRADEGELGKDGKEEYKTFTFWIRVCVGEIVA